MFKVGETVVRLVDFGELKAGDTGVVIEVRPDDEANQCVGGVLVRYFKGTVSYTNRYHYHVLKKVEDE